MRWWCGERCAASGVRRAVRRVARRAVSRNLNPNPNPDLNPDLERSPGPDPPLTLTPTPTLIRARTLALRAVCTHDDEREAARVERADAHLARSEVGLRLGLGLVLGELKPS